MRDPFRQPLCPAGQLPFAARSPCEEKHQRGGAIYSFDLNDKIGGQPANIPLNGTADGDCPGSETKDLGFVNYGLKRGGNRKIKKKRSSSNKKSKSHSNKKSKSNRKH